MEYEKDKQVVSNKVIVLDATSVLIFRFQLLQRQICEGNRRPKKVTQRLERKFIKTVYDSSQPSTRGLALQVEKDLGLRVSHGTIRNLLEKHKYSSRVARKIPLLSA